MGKTDLRYGDEVLIPWGPATEVPGTLQEVYGPPARCHVLVLLTPELTGVDEPSTVSMSIDTVKKVAPTA